jgi:sortase (surface protein transpeptidase)
MGRMRRDSKTGRRPRRRAPSLLGLGSLLAAALLLVALAGVLVTVGGESEQPVVSVAGATDIGAEPAARQLPQPAPLADAPPADARRSHARKRRAVRAPRPVRIVIPAIGVRAPVVPLGVDRAGALEVPRDVSKTGWWTGGARPGERGPAVIAGHVDSQAGPAVFFRLGDLRRGDAISVDRADGSRVWFHVARSAHHPKARFPTAKVYGPTGKPALRLITCSGAFDRTTGHYRDNTVVYAGR